MQRKKKVVMTIGAVAALLVTGLVGIASASPQRHGMYKVSDEKWQTMQEFWEYSEDQGYDQDWYCGAISSDYNYGAEMFLSHMYEYNMYELGNYSLGNIEEMDVSIFLSNACDVPLPA